MTDIVERLRGWSISDCLDAADEIERLRGELDALQTHFDIKAKRGDEKDAEIERLRGLLRPFAALDQPHNAHKADDHPLFAINSAVITCGDVRRVREALGDKDDSKNT